MAFLLGSYLSVASAQDDCRIEVSRMKYDLSSISGDHTVSRTRDTPPSSMQDTIRFNICGELNILDDVDERDQCPSGTRACLTKVNKKDSESDRVVAVVPLAQTSGLHEEHAILSSPRGLNIKIHGPPYPSSGSAEPIPQAFKLSLLCSTETSDPVFKSYEDGEAHVEWSTPAGCGFQGDEEPPKGDDKTGGGSGSGDEKEEESVGSGIGWFFLVVILVFAGYFILGAYYNYTTYGATGADLIPHRDFWREVPYMARDVVSHLCSSFRPRHTSSRGGYIAV
ncbi:hypothetical protein DENSPDRAFT_803280 [Dentipellis sp. KUC8613]|nr:hypothetical protein DENSPDRAFT_803280 [Dentipellis sp. KUC8613]